MKKLIVLFPGAGYGLDSPLLYYADFVFETKGYDRVHMNYQSILSNTELSLEEKLAKVREYVLEQVNDVDFTSYDEIIFLSGQTQQAAGAGDHQGTNLSFRQFHQHIGDESQPLAICDTDDFFALKIRKRAAHKQFLP